jgi:hypothetical protein
MGMELNSFSSIMGEKILKESRSAQLMLIWSYQQKKGSHSTSEANSHSTLEIGSAADTQDACANCSTTATNIGDAHTDCLTSIVNDNVGCLNPSQYSGSFKIIASTTDQPRGNRAASGSTDGFCAIATNTSKSIDYFKPVEYAATSPIG